MARALAWLLPRTVWGAAVTAAGMACGALLGRPFGLAVAGALLSGILFAALAAWFDARRASQLLEWLRGPMSEEAPRAGGFWGELAYRLERALRLREAAAAAERERLAQFLSGVEASPNGVLLLDAKDSIDWCSAVAAEHFGLDPQRDRRQRVTNLIRAPVFVAYLQHPEDAEAITMPRPAGSGTLSVLVRPYGEGMKLVLSQDITDRERSETMRRNFVANVSHEIRTPLTVLSGFVETLTQSRLTDPERARALALMSQQCARMQALVSDLLVLAQLEGSPRPASDEWMAVGGLLDLVRADALALSAGRHTLNFKGGADAEIAGSETELLSAFANLLTNAIRYTPPEGRIEVQWSWRADGSGVFEVGDSGIGIAREHQARLTERFYRVDGSRSRETGGTGLGLSIVKHVAQRHGGEISMDSEPGRGSRFRLVFPASRLRRRVNAPGAIAI